MAARRAAGGAGGGTAKAARWRAPSGSLREPHPPEGEDFKRLIVSVANEILWGYKKLVGVEFDRAKDAANIDKRGFSLADFKRFDADPVVIVDDRFDYGEVRYRAFGWIDGVAHMIVNTMRGRTMRLISFRRAHAKEMQRYERI